MKRFSNDASFKQLLDTKKVEIQQRTSDGVQETQQFQLLLSIFAECRRANEERDYRLILISKDDMSTIGDDASNKAHTLFKSRVFLTNRTVYIDANFEVKNCNNDPFPADNNDARRYFTSLSKDGQFVVFLIFPEAIINYFIDGHDYGGGLFYTREAQRNYEQLKSIEQLEEVLNDYRIRLTHQDTYLKFFVPKEELHALYKLIQSSEKESEFVKNHKHLLHNKPEELFREDMRTYIKEHMRVVVAREVMLEDLDRLDIELTDEIGNDLYFIEIKWVGDSIGAAGDNFGVSYDASPRIKPDAVRQVVGYIDKLLTDKQNIKVGYLAVFDARKDDRPDSGTDITENVLPEELRKHYPRFVKLPDFRVKNINPR